MIVAATPSLSGLAVAQVGRRGRPLGVIVQDFTGGGAAQTGTTGRRAAGAINKVERRLLRLADRVGVISPEFIAQIHALGIDNERISLVPNFTHIESIDVTRAEARALNLGWDADRFTVVHTGNMGLKQGLDSVIDAARMAELDGNHIRWVLVGDGNQRRTLQSRAAGIPSIEFLDLCLKRHTRTFCSVTCSCSTRLLESGNFCLPSKLTSYIVSNRPVLAATESGSITSNTICRHGIAHLVVLGDPVALLEGLKRLREDSDLVAELREHTAAYSRTTGWRTAAHRYVEFVATLADRH